jgi:hypothetical protein
MTNLRSHTVLRVAIAASLGIGTAIAAPAPAPKPTAPKTAAPAAVPPPSVAWNSQDQAYELNGFPAVSGDGSMLLFALTAGDAHGHTDLSVERVGARGGTAGDGENLPTLQGPTRAPTADALAKAAAYLKHGQATYHWSSLSWHAISLRDGGGGDGTSATVDGFVVAMTTPHDESKLTLKKNGKLIVVIDLAKDLKHAVQSPAQPKCGGEPHLAGIGIDPAHRLAVIAIREVSPDGCFRSDAYAIHTWK